MAVCGNQSWYYCLAIHVDYLRTWRPTRVLVRTVRELGGIDILVN